MTGKGVLRAWGAAAPVLGAASMIAGGEYGVSSGFELETWIAAAVMASGGPAAWRAGRLDDSVVRARFSPRHGRAARSRTRKGTGKAQE